MKVLFIYSRDDVQSGTIHFGISYISALLKANGHRTRLFVVDSNKWRSSTDSLRSEIDTYDPGLVCFSAVFSQYRVIEELARFVRNGWSDKFLLIGGIHASLNPVSVIDAPFDALCVGEGEFPTLELCSQLECRQRPEGIANLWIKRSDGTIEKNAPRAFIEPLDCLPPMDQELWTPWMKDSGSEKSILLGRGCPYACAYCCNHALRKLADGKYVRMRSPQNIISELAAFHAAYPDRTLGFEVESIALDKPWLLELCRQLEEFNSRIGNALAYSCNFRISRQTTDESLFVALKRANFFRIHIGLESGSPRIRSEVLRRHYSNEEFLSVVAMARRQGLKVYVYNMIGMPGESLRDHMETVALNRQCQPDGLTTSLFFPYPGTALYNTCLKEGLIKGPITTDRERREASLALPNFSKRQIQHAYTWFNYRVYRGYRPRWVLLLQVLIVKINSNPTAHLFYRSIVRWRMLQSVRAQLRKKLARWR